MLRIDTLDKGWEFRRLGHLGAAEAWAPVDLPHSSVTVDLNGRGHWLGECEYRRTVQVEKNGLGSRYALYLGAAMHSAVVRVDGREAGRHAGGYLPFEVDLTDFLADGLPHSLVVRIDNRDNPDVPPGKPFADLDFCWYGGLYRNAELRTYPPVHVTDPVAAGETAGGGVFVRTLRASEAEAVVSIKTHVRNAGSSGQTVTVAAELQFGGDVAATGRSKTLVLASGSSEHSELTLTLASPHLWAPSSPSLYLAKISVLDGAGRVLDQRCVRLGVRRIAFSRSGGFVLNGKRLRLRGTNRHQEYPYLGYALPRAAQYRDAKRIKEAGFDYVRLSHYPQSPDFLDACDELGIVVMNAIPGWQFIGGERFCRACFQAARDLVQRDRNHPCVVLWELSLNETEMPDEFMAELHKIGHEEYPGDQLFTCGWKDRFDVYLRSRQHGEIHSWANGDKALVVAEYGDWEYYASNHGFDQKTGAGLHAAWSNSRQLRSSGEAGLRQQALNHLTALNDTLASPAVLDGQWTVFDYVRGYHPLRAATGVMDVFRLPKYSYYFYRSQRDVDENGANWNGGPVVFIASEWNAASNLRVLVFSNCEEIELRLGAQVIGRQGPSRTAGTQFLPHPPFVFDLPGYVAEVLEAVGYVGGRVCARHRVGGPRRPVKLGLEIADEGVVASSGESDLLFAYARWQDDQGDLCGNETAEISFAVTGDAEIVGPARVAVEAGIASVLLRVPAGAREFRLCATSVGALPAATVWQHWTAASVEKTSRAGHHRAAAVSSS